MNRRRVLGMAGALAGALAAALAGAGRAPAADPLDGRVGLTLRGALVYRTIHPPRGAWADRQDLRVDLVSRAGAWDEAAWAWAPHLPGQEHLGRVTRAEAGPDGVRLDIDLTVNHSRQDPCTLGGRARLRVDLKREGEALVGTFTAHTEGADGPEVRAAVEEAWGLGRVPGRQGWAQSNLENRLAAALRTASIAGAAEGTVRPHPPRAPDARPFAPGEHPRLFFRQSDVPDLRRRAETPHGRRILADLKALLERADRYGYGYHPPRAEHSMGPVWATGWGLLYQLTGDPAYARKAGEQFWGNLYGAYYYGGGWLHAYTLAGLAVTYDLCADAWDDDLRGLVYGYLEHNIRDLAHRHDGRDPLGVLERYYFANDQAEFQVRGPDDGYATKFRAGAALAALVLMHDPPPVYAPTPPAAAVPLDPPTDYEPWVGVPVVKLESDKMFREWLVNGPFLRGTTDRAMDQLGGWRDLRPEPGTTVEVEGTRLDFRRYRPAGATDPNGPTIYCRDCNRYWTSSTGGGYWPGIELVRRWRERLGQNPAINVVLYAVLDNDEERVVQALPNWRSRSAGNRMWIAGRPVRDGDLVRLKAGLYPVAVDVSLLGGYSAMAPKLRRYTEEMYAADAARRREALRAYGGRGVFENEMERHLAILQRSICRYVELAVGDKGWGGWATHETVLPFLTAWRDLMGEDLARGTGLEELVPLAARMRGHMRDRPFDTMVSQSFALMPERHRGLAWWYLDRYGLGIGRPLDAVIALATHPTDGRPAAPDGRLALAEAFERHGIYTFAAGWDGPRDPFALIETGRPAPGNSVYAAGNLRIQAFGRFWAEPYWDGRHPERGYTELNNVSVRLLYPTGPARVTCHDAQPDGSGSITLVMDELRDLVRLEQNVFELSREDPGIVIQRSVAADYSGKSGAPALFVTADKIAGAGRREKVWRMKLGEVYTTTAYNRREPTLQVGERSVTVRPAGSDATLRVTFVLPETVDLATRPPRIKEPRGTVLEAKVDRHVGEQEAAEQASLGDHADAVRDALENGLGGRPDTDGRGPPPTRPSNPPRTGIRATDTLEDSVTGLLDRFDARMVREKKEADRRLPPTHFVAVMTLVSGARPEARHPEVRAIGAGDHLTIYVGDQVVRYDGARLTVGP